VSEILSKTDSIRIERLSDIDSLRQCIDIQKRAWGFDDADVLPLRMLVVCGRIGGHVLGARSLDGRIQGFVNAFPGYRDGKVFLHSQMMGVVPESQNLGIGRRLKWAQRAEALRQGIGTIEWTFDPLEIRNAHFNIALLGVICRRYLANTYGITSSPLHGGLPTDRVVAEWHLKSQRIESLFRGATGSVSPVASHQVVELPLNIGELKSSNPALALELQRQFREQVTRLMEDGLAIVGHEIDQALQVARFLFAPSELPCLNL
jgi:predicted GNAT superfamily acetyltransferase